MLRFFNAMLVVSALVSGAVLYALEHTTRELERKIARLERGIAGEIEDMRFLSAEWSSLTRPDRIGELARRHLGLETLKANQVVEMGELTRRVPPEPIVKLEAEGVDPIGAIIDKMQQ
jgi:cell division protein FtsL